MTETKKSLAILKARWPEVTLIIGLNVLSLFFNKLILIAQFKTTLLQGFVDFSYFIVLIVIVQLLIIAFQRTLYLEGPKRQSPVTLLHAGKHFFWRMIKLWQELPTIGGNSARDSGIIDLNIDISENADRLYIDYIESRKEEIQAYFPGFYDSLRNSGCSLRWRRASKFG